MSKHQWKSHEIEIKSVAAARHLWFTVGFEIYLDGKLIAKSPTKFEGLKTQVPFTIESEGIVDSGLVISKAPASVLFTKYLLLINGTEVGKGHVIARNWYITYFLIAIIFATPFILQAFKA